MIIPFVTGVFPVEFDSEMRQELMSGLMQIQKFEFTLHRKKSRPRCLMTSCIKSETLAVLLDSAARNIWAETNCI